MKQTTQENLAIFSQTLPFFLIRSGLLILFSILSLILLGLLLLLLPRLGIHDPNLAALILLGCLPLFWLAARILQRMLLQRIQAAHLALLARMAGGKRAWMESTLQSGRLLVDNAGCATELPLLQSDLRRLSRRILLPRLREQRRGMLDRLWVRIGLSYLENALMGIAIESAEPDWASSLLQAAAGVWEKSDLASRFGVRIGRLDVLGLIASVLLLSLPLLLLFGAFSVPIVFALVFAVFLGIILKCAFLSPFLQSAAILQYHAILGSNPPSAAAIEALRSSHKGFNSLV